MVDILEPLEETIELTERQMIAQLAMKKLKVIQFLQEGVAKKGYNETQKYPFAQASDVKKGVGAAFVAVGLALRMTPTHHERIVLENTDPNKIKPWRLTVFYQIDLIDCATGFVESSLWPGECTLHGNDDKGWNKCSTQAEKYFLLANFLVGTKEDDDQDNDGDGSRRNQSQRQSRNQRPPLTNGRGEPRDVPPARNGNGTPPAPAAAPAMLSQLDEVKWPKFVSFAKDQYGLEPASVPHAIWQLTKSNDPFNGERDHAIAALLAASAQYDPKVIQEKAKDKEFVTEKVIRKAIEIAKSYTLPE